MSTKKYNVTSSVDYVSGHFRYVHFEASLSEEYYQDFSKLTLRGQQEYLVDVGDLVIDDWEVDDLGDLQEIIVTEEGA